MTVTIVIIRYRSCLDVLLQSQGSVSYSLLIRMVTNTQGTVKMVICWFGLVSLVWFSAVANPQVFMVTNTQGLVKTQLGRVVNKKDRASVLGVARLSNTALHYAVQLWTELEVAALFLFFFFFFFFRWPRSSTSAPTSV